MTDKQAIERIEKLSLKMLEAVPSDEDVRFAIDANFLTLKALAKTYISLQAPKQQKFVLAIFSVGFQKIMMELERELIPPHSADRRCHQDHTTLQ